MLFNAQMLAYCEELSKLDIKLESILKWFFEIYLNDEFLAQGFTFSSPSDGTNDLEKCKLLAAEIDSVLKQFEMFVKDGCINRDLFEMSSGHIKLENVPSFSREKYVYPKNDICKGCINLLFSDQTGLGYTEKTRDKYSVLYSLLKNETMYLNDFTKFQKPQIHWLLQHDCLKIGENGKVSLNLEKGIILKHLYNNQYSCLFFLDHRNGVLQGMMHSGEVQSEASLFSKPEQAYLNYMLNKAEFSNGHDLRNKYLHGTHSLNLLDHKIDYVELLKIMILIVIKINEEFCFRKDMNDSTAKRSGTLLENKEV